MISRILKVIVKNLNNIKMKNKLMLSYFILIMIPLGLFTMFSYSQVSKYVEGLVQYSARQVFEQTGSFLVYKMEKIVNAMDIITIDQNVYNTLSKSPEYYEITDQIKDMDSLTGYLKSYQRASDIYSVKLYLNDAFIYSREGVNLFGMIDCRDKEWYKRLISNSGDVTFSSNSEMEEEATVERIISIQKAIRDFNNFSKYVGILRIDVLESNIKEIVKKANTTKSGASYLQNSTGQILACSNTILSEKWKLPVKYCKQLSLEKTNWAEITIDNEMLNIGCKNIEGTDWYLVSIIPNDEIVSSSKTLRNQMYLLMLIVATLAYILAYFISSSSTKRITQLTRRMKRVQNGDLNAIIAASGKDEIGDLVENFNYMLKKIGDLAQNQYETGLEVKSAELKALQAQINPHFLYNTLDLISWTAIKNDVPEISSIVKSLARFYKVSLSKGKDIVTIREELEHVLLYVDIQNRRFDDSIKLIVNIAEELYEYSILKIILQPIVENSILHGIMEKEDCSGTVSISGAFEDNDIILRVSDDGVGISEEKLKSIYVGDSKDHGYGIKNINNRIKLYYGEKYGLSYSSIPGKGTVVEIRIPAVGTA